MPLECLLVADDLTGACDAAVHFAARGVAASVVMELVVTEGPADEARVLAVSTESRDLAPGEIRARIAGAARSAPAAERVFKKIDSTLRGNPGVEIAAAMEEFRCDRAVVCPAFPEFASRGGGWAAAREGDGGLCADRPGRADRAWVCPRAACGDRVYAGARRVLRCGGRRGPGRDRRGSAVDGAAGAVAGSGGLARAMARLIGGPYAATPLAPTRTGTVLFCIGSEHPATVAQVAALVAERPGRHVLLRIPWGRILAAEAAGWIAAVPAAALVVSGGDTASLVMRAIGARRDRVV